MSSYVTTTSPVQASCAVIPTMNRSSQETEISDCPENTGASLSTKVNICSCTIELPQLSTADHVRKMYVMHPST